MRILSFDTAGSAIALALMEDRQPVLAQTVEPASQQNRQETATMLIPTIKKALAECQWPKTTLSLIVVGQGPGSFTGIRNGVITARTLCQALNLPLIAVANLECLAWQAILDGQAILDRQKPSSLAVVLSAAGGHCFLAAYQGSQNSRLSPLTEALIEPSYVACAQLPKLIGHLPLWLVDSKAEKDLLPDDVPNQTERLPRKVSLPVIKNIAICQGQIALNRLSLTMNSQAEKASLVERFPWSTIYPLYLRGPSVTLRPGS